MTKEKFQQLYQEEYVKFMSSACGQAFISTLSELIPNYEHPKEPHLYADNRGKRAGYEYCIRNVILLSMIIEKRKELEPTYGVPDTK